MLFKLLTTNAKSGQNTFTLISGVF